MPRPRDFTFGRYKIRSTETGSVPTDEDLMRTVRQGLYGTRDAGVADESCRTPTSVTSSVHQDLVAAHSPREPPEPVAPAPPVPSSPESVRAAQSVYDRLQCGKCHGDDGHGTGQRPRRSRTTGAAAAMPRTSPNRGRSTAVPRRREIYMRFRTGMSGTPMPSFKDAASDAEMWDLANYVVSLAPKAGVGDEPARGDRRSTRGRTPDAEANPAKRGDYLVDTLGCALCHSPVDEHETDAARHATGGRPAHRI